MIHSARKGIVCLLVFLKCSLLVRRLKYRTFCHCRNSWFIISRIVSVISRLYYFLQRLSRFLKIDMTVARPVLNFIKQTYPLSVTILFCGGLDKTNAKVLYNFYVKALCPNFPSVLPISIVYLDIIFSSLNSSLPSSFCPKPM